MLIPENHELHILIVDDDIGICNLISEFLSKHQIQTSIALNINEAEQKLHDHTIHLLVLDLMMPGEDGLSFCRRWRNSSGIPIIMLTAMAEDTDRIIGLEMGADDYLAKPFNPRELLARIRAVLRRYNQSNQSHKEIRQQTYCYNGWRLNPLNRELLNAEQALVTLTSGEFDLLQIFVERPQQILSRDQLLELAKGRSGIAYDRSIDVQLSRLRHKVELDPKHPELIKTIRNSGYLFTAQVDIQTTV